MFFWARQRICSCCHVTPAVVMNHCHNGCTPLVQVKRMGSLLMLCSWQLGNVTNFSARLLGCMSLGNRGSFFFCGLWNNGWRCFAFGRLLAVSRARKKFFLVGGFFIGWLQGRSCPLSDSQQFVRLPRTCQF